MLNSIGFIHFSDRSKEKIKVIRYHLLIMTSSVIDFIVSGIEGRESLFKLADIIVYVFSCYTNDIENCVKV